MLGVLRRGSGTSTSLGLETPEGTKRNDELKRTMGPRYLSKPSHTGVNQNLTETYLLQRYRHSSSKRLLSRSWKYGFRRRRNSEGSEGHRAEEKLCIALIRSKNRTPNCEAKRWMTGRRIDAESFRMSKFERIPQTAATITCSSGPGM
jgi:hypothetical protein